MVVPDLRILIQGGNNFSANTMVEEISKLVSTFLFENLN